MARLCDREFEVLEAAAGAMGAELREHIAECATCRDLYGSARAIVEDRTALMRSAPIPSAGLVWWRANMRAQREAARATVRVGGAIQALLLITAVVVAFAILGLTIDVHAVAHSVLASARNMAIPLIAFAAWLILAPVAVYFAVTEK